MTATGVAIDKTLDEVMDERQEVQAAMQYLSSHLGELGKVIQDKRDFAGPFDRDSAIKKVKHLNGLLGWRLGDTYRHVYDELSDVMGEDIRACKSVEKYPTIVDYVAAKGYMPHMHHLLNDAIDRVEDGLV